MTTARQPQAAVLLIYSHSWYVTGKTAYIQGLENTLVVVTRWFGGVLLGPERFKHINRAARDALTKGGQIPVASKKRG